MNPLNAIGALMHHKNKKEHFVGTCFSFKSPRHFITAKHCLPEDLGSVTVALPSLQKSITACGIATHDDADLAILYFDEEQNDLNGIEPFTLMVSNYGLGEEFISYGFPEDMIGPNIGHPTPRLFRGYYQRFFDHRSHMGCSYSAGELNIACPGGLSGSPLFRPEAHTVLTGLVTENLEASTELWTEESEATNENKSTHLYHRVINYGVALMLDKHLNWIEENIKEFQELTNSSSGHS